MNGQSAYCLRSRYRPRPAPTFGTVAAACLSGLLLAACSSGTPTASASRADAAGFSVPRPIPARPVPARHSKRLPAGYHLGKPYQVKGQWYRPRVDPDYEATGIASWYGPGFHGRPTANGETFDETKLTAAHKTLPLPSLVRVTNLSNGRSVVVRVNDRGPFISGRIIDLSSRAGDALAMRHHGAVKVRVTYLGLAPLRP